MQLKHGFGMKLRGLRVQAVEMSYVRSDTGVSRMDRMSMKECKSFSNGSQRRREEM